MIIKLIRIFVMEVLYVFFFKDMLKDLYEVMNVKCWLYGI